MGATFANSGKTELAIQYYLEALDIQPGYVRARFNLAVANMNLGQYEEAIQHLITSLSIQEEAAQLEGQFGRSLFSSGGSLTRSPLQREAQATDRMALPRKRCGIRSTFVYCSQSPSPRSLRCSL